jgi:hypothetical protein
LFQKIPEEELVMATPRRATTKKRESVIVREGMDKIEINESEQLGLKWNKPSAVMTGARKVKSASGGQEEQTAAGPRRVLKEERIGRTKVDAPAALTIGFGKGRSTGLNKARRLPRVATAASAPSSRAEPRLSRSARPARSRSSAR